MRTSTCLYLYNFKFSAS